MRTVKASEVVKGMRVRWEDHYSDATVTTEGLVSSATNGPAFAHIDLGSARQVGRSIDKDHPVTVLAEPEPEWVEGAWYRCQVGENEPENLRRLPHGWTPFHDTDRVFHLDDDPDVSVLGRVLVVDWPGDDVAGEVLEMFPHNDRADWQAEDNIACQAVADAIRTQGGVR